MLHLSQRSFFVAAILAGAGAATPAAAQVPAGVLECTVSGGVGVVVASNKALSCIYHRGPHRRPEFYAGSISHIGFDLGITGQGHLLFGVLAPAPRLHHYALAGSYAGPLIGATVGGGTDANGLVSSDGAIALQSGLRHDRPRPDGRDRFTDIGAGASTPRSSALLSSSPPPLTFLAQNDGSFAIGRS